MSSGSENGDQQDSGNGFVKSLVKALSGTRWTPGRKYLGSRSTSPTESEMAYSLAMAQTGALLLPAESQPKSTETDDKIRSASRDDNLSRQEDFQSSSVGNEDDFPYAPRKGENLLASDQNLLSDLQRISDFAASRGFGPGIDALGERVGRNDAVTRINFGAFRGDPVSQFRSAASPYSRHNVVQAFPTIRDGVHFSPRHPQDQASVYGGTEFSTRQGRRDSTNVTSRDVKRPKERARDREYKKRFSMESSKEVGHGSPSTPLSPPLGGHSWPREEDKSQRAEVMVDSTSLRDQPSRSQIQGRDRRDLAATGVETPFQIRLVFEGRSVYHRVWATMPVIQLIDDASDIFGIESDYLLDSSLSFTNDSEKGEYSFRASST
jgi:hypothetical protein